MTDSQLIESLETLRDLMVKVATNVERIPDVNDRFRRLYSQVASALVCRNIANPLPFGDLWDWYARWRSGDMPTYQSRRTYLSDLFSPLLAQVARDVSKCLSRPGGRESIVWSTNSEIVLRLPRPRNIFRPLDFFAERQLSVSLKASSIHRSTCLLTASSRVQRTRIGCSRPT